MRCGLAMRFTSDWETDVRKETYQYEVLFELREKRRRRKLTLFGRRVDGYHHQHQLITRIIHLLAHLPRGLIHQADRVGLRGQLRTRRERLLHLHLALLLHLGLDKLVGLVARLAQAHARLEKPLLNRAQQRVDGVKYAAGGHDFDGVVARDLQPALVAAEVLAEEDA